LTITFHPFAGQGPIFTLFARGHWCHIADVITLVNY